MAATAWRGYLTFGLVSIPLKLYPAARGTSIQFHQVHKKCRTRLRRPLYCPTCQRLVEQDEVAKAYEYEKGQYLILDDNEIKKLAPETGGTMEIGEFVKLAEIDPLYFETSYFAVPDKSGAKPYRLLVEALEKTGMAGLAKVAMHRREYLVVIRPHDNGLTLHTMYFNNEIREVAEYGKDNVEVKPQEIKLATELVGSLSAEFEPEKYHDEYQARVQALLDRKLKGEKIAVAAERKPAPVIDMMEALKKSLAKREQEKKRASHHAPARSARMRRKAS
jgi:DNA end-binding protein Ku